MDNCPKCNVALDPMAEECTQCGILLSKWQQREENVASGNLSRYSIANATSSAFNWTILGIFACSLVLIFLYLEKSQ
jgi:hypothetical protein